MTMAGVDIIPVNVANEETQLAILDKVNATAGLVTDINGKRYEAILDTLHDIDYDAPSFQERLQASLDAINSGINVSNMETFMSLMTPNEDLYIGATGKLMVIFDASTMEILSYKELTEGFVAFVEKFGELRFFYDDKYLYVTQRQYNDDTTANNTHYTFGFFVFDKFTFQYVTTTARASIGVNIGTSLPTQLPAYSNGNGITWFMVQLPGQTNGTWFLSKINFDVNGIPIGHSSMATTTVYNTNGGKAYGGLPNYNGDKMLVLEDSGTWFVIREMDMGGAAGNSAITQKVTQISTGTSSQNFANRRTHVKYINGEQNFIIPYSNSHHFVFNRVTAKGGIIAGGQTLSVVDHKNQKMYSREPNTSVFRKSDRTVGKMRSIHFNFDGVAEVGQVSYASIDETEPVWLLFDDIDVTTSSGWNNNPNVTKSMVVDGVIYLYDSNKKKHYPVKEISIIRGYKEV